MRILKTKRFAKLATDEGLTDEALKVAIKEFEEGLTGDELGASLYKKRVAVSRRYNLLCRGLPEKQEGKHIKD